MTSYLIAQDSVVDTSASVNDVSISISNVVTRFIPKHIETPVVIKQKDSVVTRPGNWEVMLTTQEFDEFRRVLLIYRMMDSSKTELIEPELIPSKEKTTFQILLKNVAPKSFLGDSLIKNGIKYPIQLSTHIVDIRTLRIEAKVKKYSDIVSYSITGENKFIFDIYKESTFETFFKEKTIPGNLNNIKKGKRISIAKNESFFENIRNQYEPIIYKSLIYAGLAIVFIIVVFVLLNRRFKHVKKVEEKDAMPPVSPPSPVFQETLAQVESDIKYDNSDEYIRQIMDEKQISYDEAIMMVNIQGLKQERNEDE